MLTDSLLASRFEAVNRIRREFASLLMDGVAPNALCDNYNSVLYEHFDPEPVFQALENENCIAACGLSSWLLRGLYESAGYRSLTYNCGYGDGSATSHELVVVDIGIPESPYLVFQDAYYNFSLIDERGIPMQFDTVIAKLRNGRHEDVKMLADTSMVLLKIDGTIDTALIGEDCIRHYTSALSGTGGKIPRNFHFLTSSNCENFASRMIRRMEQDSLSSNFLYFLTMPLVPGIKEVHSHFGAAD